MNDAQNMPDPKAEETMVLYIVCPTAQAVDVLEQVCANFQATCPPWIDLQTSWEGYQAIAARISQPQPASVDFDFLRGPLAERDPNGCGCRYCNPKAWWFVVCSICGNKRCPHAEDHAFKCTRSNEPGQKPVYGESEPLPPQPASSRCCRAPLVVDASDEGTCFYRCSKCGQPADAAQPAAQDGEDAAARSAHEMNCIGLLLPYENETKGDAIQQAALIIRREFAATTQDESDYADATETHPKFAMDAMRANMGHLLTTVRATLFVINAPAGIQDAMKYGKLATVKAWMESQRPAVETAASEHRVRELETVIAKALGLLRDMTDPECNSQRAWEILGSVGPLLTTPPPTARKEGNP